MPARRTTLLLLCVLVVASLSACAGVSVYTQLIPDPGSVVFGSAVKTSIAVINPMSSARLTEEVGVAAHLSHSVTGPVGLRIRVGDQTVVNESSVYTFTTQGDGLATNYDLSVLPGPGHYVFEYLQGSEVLATGALDVTAPTSTGSRSS
jgi:hypothetical protein